VETLQFLDRVRQSRLLGEDRLLEVMRRFSGAAEASAVAGALVHEGVLTAYQARRIWEGQQAGLVLGQYHILDEIGKGGFGEVYKALHTYMNRVVALKVSRSDLLEDRKVRALFRREVLAATQLSHPNVVMAYDANEVDGLLYWTMEYVEGCDLDTLVRQRGPLAVPLALEMLRQAALALQHAHEKGMVHRDIKPGNLLVPREALERGAGVLVKVVDFGLARVQTTMSGATFVSQGAGTFCGTPDYVSPEQARSPHDVDIRSDLYSLGCAFHYALTGHRPFRGTTVLEVVVKHLQEAPPRIEELSPDVPAEVAAVVRRLMAKDPAQRYQTPAELAAEVAALQVRGVTAEARGPALSALEPAPASVNRLTAGTALVPRLAFWEGPVCQSPAAALAELECVPRTDTAPPEDTSATRRIPLPADEPAPDPEAPTLPDAAHQKCEAPVEPAARPASDRELRRWWSEWTGIISRLVNGKRVAIAEPDYRELHRSLLEAVRQRKEADAPRQGEWRKLEQLLEPWLALSTLGWADKPTLDSLLACAAELAEPLDLEDNSLRAWHLLVASAVLTAALLLPLYLDRLPRLPVFSMPTLVSFSRFIETHPYLCAGVGGPLLLVLLSSLLLRWLR
jgi:hypothetical protein